MKYTTGPLNVLRMSACRADCRKLLVRSRTEIVRRTAPHSLLTPRSLLCLYSKPAATDVYLNVSKLSIDKQLLNAASPTTQRTNNKIERRRKNYKRSTKFSNRRSSDLLAGLPQLINSKSSRIRRVHRSRTNNNRHPLLRLMLDIHH